MKYFTKNTRVCRRFYKHSRTRKSALFNEPASDVLRLCLSNEFEPPSHLSISPSAYFSEYSKHIVKGSVILLLLLADAMPRILCRQHLTQHDILFLVDSNSNSNLTDIVVVSWTSPEYRHSYLDDISKFVINIVVVMSLLSMQVQVKCQ